MMTTDTHPISAIYIVIYQFLCAILVSFETDAFRAWSIWTMALLGFLINIIINRRKLSEWYKELNIKKYICEFFGR